MRKHLRQFELCWLPLLLCALGCAGKSVSLDGAPTGGSGNAVEGDPNDEPAQEATVLRGLPFKETILDLAVDEHRLYYAGEFSSGASAEYSVRSCQKARCSETVADVVTPRLADRDTSLLTRAEDQLYWLAGRSLYRCDAASCAPQLIVDDVADFQLFGGRLFVSTSTTPGRFLSCSPQTCSTPMSLPLGAAPSPARGFAVVGAHAYWVGQRTLWQLRLDGTEEAKALRELPEVDDGPVAVGPSHLFWAVSRLVGSIQSCSLPDCAEAPQTLVETRRPSLPLLDAKRLYFEHQNVNGDRELATCALSGCASPEPISTTSTGVLSGIGTRATGITPKALDEHFIYVVMARLSDMQRPIANYHHIQRFSKPKP